MISENKPEGMSKEAALLTIFLLEHTGREAVVEVQSNGWLGQRSELWKVDKFREHLAEINNPEHTAYGKQDPLYGPISNVLDKSDASVGVDEKKVEVPVEYREISEDVIDRAAQHVIRIAKTETLNSFIFWMWHYYDKLDFADHAQREEQLGNKAIWIPSNIQYQNLSEARIKYFLTVLQGAEDVLARSIYYWVERHKTAAFTFKKSIFPVLDENQAKSLFQKMVKYGIQEGSYRSVDYMLIRILAELIVESKKHNLTVKVEDLIKGLEPVDIQRRKKDNPREFETVSIPAEVQRGWLLAGLYAFYFERQLPQRTRDTSLPSMGEINELLQALVVGHESDFQVSQERIDMSVSEILNKFARGDDGTAASPVSNENVGGIDMRSYDRFFNNYSGELNTIFTESDFSIGTEWNGILPVINGITPITSLQFFYSN